MLTLNIKGHRIYILSWILMAPGHKDTCVRGHMSPYKCGVKVIGVFSSHWSEMVKIWISAHSSLYVYINGFSWHLDTRILG